MEICWDILFWWLIIVGHLGVWCSLFNRIHATAWPRARRKHSEKLIFLLILLPMVWVLAILTRNRTTSIDAIYQVNRYAYWYGIGCLFVSGFFLGKWIYRKSVYRVPSAVTARTVESIVLNHEPGKSLLHGKRTRLLGWLPFNQILDLRVEKTTFELDRLPQSGSGLRISQLSDLHFTGKIDLEFFNEVVRQSNAFKPDFVFITGDIIDKISCLDWIATVFGNLSANCGKFYVLGNHDLRIPDEAMLRSKMADQGFVAACGQWHSIQFNDLEIQVTGNESPWYSGALKIDDHPDMEAGGKSRSQVRPVFRILLSHSPDQFKWAREHGIDLMFAGHTHGGQIRIPIVGPIVAPSRYGVWYSSGTFEIDEMIMHVTRGLSGDDPIRINCPPELGLFTLVASRSPTK